MQEADLATNVWDGQFVLVDSSSLFRSTNCPCHTSVTRILAATAEALATAYMWLECYVTTVVETICLTPMTSEILMQLLGMCVSVANTPVGTVH